ncbi:MAG: symmetrical bis(5'-nucleosyl)-tetraphosphatase [Aestuariibacter sp.]
MATYVVGDIQACFKGLTALLDVMDFSPSRDKLWAVGDLIGRGPHALETLRYLYGLDNAFDTVLGNHDLHFLAVSQGIRPARPKDGFAPLLASEDLPVLVQWLRTRPLAVRPQPHYFLSHAGLYPLWQEQQALLLAQEASDALQQDDWRDTIDFMYGSKEWAWQDSFQGKKRIKFIIDALTRMRFVDGNGTLNFSAKTVLDEAPDGFVAWFNHPQLQHNTQLLFGHWAALQGYTGKDAIEALDTGYIWGGQLTALNLDTGERISVHHSKD